MSDYRNNASTHGPPQTQAPASFDAKVQGSSAHASSRPNTIHRYSPPIGPDVEHVGEAMSILRAKQWSLPSAQWTGGESERPQGGDGWRQAGDVPPDQEADGEAWRTRDKPDLEHHLARRILRAKQWSLPSAQWTGGESERPQGGDGWRQAGDVPPDQEADDEMATRRPTMRLALSQRLSYL